MGKSLVAFLEETDSWKLQPAQNILFLINDRQNLIPHAMIPSPSIKSYMEERQQMMG